MYNFLRIKIHLGTAMAIVGLGGDIFLDAEDDDDLTFEDEYEHLILYMLYIV